jgi:hypothetical protein
MATIERNCPGCAAKDEKLRLCGSDQALADVIYDMVQVDKAQQHRIGALEQERDAYMRQNGGLQESLDIREQELATLQSAVREIKPFNHDGYKAHVVWADWNKLAALVPQESG